MRRTVAGVLIWLTTLAAVGKAAPHTRVGVVSDWTHRHVLFPDSKDASKMARLRRDPRWVQNWYNRHPDTWWPEHHRPHGGSGRRYRRDWNVTLSSSSATASFEPVFDFSFSLVQDTGYGSLNTTDAGAGQFLATAGSVNVTATDTGVIGTYALLPGGPDETYTPDGWFLYDNLLYPSVDPVLDTDGLLFTDGNGFEVNIANYNQIPGSYVFEEFDGTELINDDAGAPFTINAAPGAGQTFPAKYVFDVTAAPSCTNDFVAIGIPANPALGGQANIVGYNNLYSSASLPAACTTGAPTVMFAYASGTGQVPAYVEISQSGTQLAYVENQLTGSSYFHVLTIGTTGDNGASATEAAVPGSGNNAVDQTVLLSPDGGKTTQSSTNAPFVVYTTNDANDVAYVTTYSRAGSGSGYLYKIGNVFNGATPTILWSAPITAVPSTPIYDSVSNRVFFTDSNGSIDYVTDTGTSPTVVYGAVLATGATSENPVTLDSTNQMIYATFNSNGTSAVVVQASSRAWRAPSPCPWAHPAGPTAGRTAWNLTTPGTPVRKHRSCSWR